LTSNSKTQNNFFDYIRFIGKQGVELQDYKSKRTQKPRQFTRFRQTKIIRKRPFRHRRKFILANKGTYIADVVNLKTERILKNVPMLSNGKKDSIAEFNYYKKHYWDNVDFKDDATVRNPFFNIKIKNISIKSFMYIPILLL
jgi:hypothetical protein